VTQRGIVHVAMLALEEKVEVVLPAVVRWNELFKVHHHCCIALIEHHEQVIKDLALALPPSAPARLKSRAKVSSGARHNLLWEELRSKGLKGGTGGCGHTLRGGDQS
jgi:hypothetical protein